MTEQDGQPAAAAQNDLEWAMLESLPAHVALLDEDGTILAVNGAWRRFGAANGLRHPCSGIGENYLTLCDRAALANANQEGAAAVAAALRSVMAGTIERFAIDYPCDAPNEQRWFRCIGAPIAGRVRRGAIVMHIDSTEAKRREDMQRQAQKLEALGRLTSGIAHDFNNLLTVIVGSLESLETVCVDRPKAASLVERSKAAALRAERLVGQLLGFARRQPLRSEPLDCNHTVQEIGKWVASTLPKAIQLMLAPAPSLWLARADRDQPATALLNLVTNARDAVAERGGGRITLRTSNVTLNATELKALAASDIPPGDYVEIAVIDDGAGMSPAVLAHAFEPFFTTKEPNKGTGLGLAQLYGFAKQSGGHVTIDSIEGSGTKVRLLLPRALEQRTGSALLRQ